jgi:hypothetical protein
MLDEQGPGQGFPFDEQASGARHSIAEMQRLFSIGFKEFDAFVRQLHGDICDF